MYKELFVILPYYYFDVYGHLVISYSIPGISNLYILFALSVLLEVCQCYWSFQCISSLLIFSILLFFISLISAVFLLFPSFYLLSSFLSSSLLRWDFKLVIWNVFLLSGISICAITFPLSIALAMCHKFWYVYF